MDLIIKELETRLTNCFNIKFSFSDFKNNLAAKVNLLGSLLYLFDEAFKLDGIDFLYGGGQRMVKSQEDENVNAKKRLKTSQSQLKSFLNRAGLGHLISQGINLLWDSDMSRFVRTVSTLMDVCEQRHGNHLKIKVRQLSAKAIRQVVKKPASALDSKSTDADEIRSQDSPPKQHEIVEIIPSSRREIPRTPLHKDSKNVDIEKPVKLDKSFSDFTEPEIQLRKTKPLRSSPKRTMPNVSSEIEVKDENIVTSNRSTPTRPQQKLQPESAEIKLKNIIPMGSQLLRTPLKTLKKPKVDSNDKVPVETFKSCSPIRNAIPTGSQLPRTPGSHSKKLHSDDANISNKIENSKSGLKKITPAIENEITKLPVKPLKNIIPSGSCIPRTPFHDRMEDVAQENEKDLQESLFFGTEMLEQSLVESGISLPPKVLNKTFVVRQNKPDDENYSKLLHGEDDNNTREIDTNTSTHTLPGESSLSKVQESQTSNPESNVGKQSMVESTLVISESETTLCKRTRFVVQRRVQKDLTEVRKEIIHDEKENSNIERCLVIEEKDNQVCDYHQTSGTDEEKNINGQALRKNQRPEDEGSDSATNTREICRKDEDDKLNISNDVSEQKPSTRRGRRTRQEISIGQSERGPSSLTSGTDEEKGRKKLKNINGYAVRKNQRPEDEDGDSTSNTREICRKDEDNNLNISNDMPEQKPSTRRSQRTRQEISIGQSERGPSSLASGTDEGKGRKKLKNINGYAVRKNQRPEDEGGDSTSNTREICRKDEDNNLNISNDMPEQKISLRRGRRTRQEISIAQSERETPSSLSSAVTPEFSSSSPLENSHGSLAPEGSRPRRACRSKPLADTTIAENIDPLKIINQKSFIDDFLYSSPNAQKKVTRGAAKIKVLKEKTSPRAEFVGTDVSNTKQKIKKKKDSRSNSTMFEEGERQERPRRACTIKKDPNQTIAEELQPLVLSSQKPYIDDRLYKTPEAVKVPVLQTKVTQKRGRKYKGKLKRNLEDEVDGDEENDVKKSFGEKVLLVEISDEMLLSSSRSTLRY